MDKPAIVGESQVEEKFLVLYNSTQPTNLGLGKRPFKDRKRLLDTCLWL